MAQTIDLCLMIGSWIVCLGLSFLDHSYYQRKGVIVSVVLGAAVGVGILSTFNFLLR